MRNAQGDVVQIRDSQNQAIANYHYDAWGKLLSITDANGKSQSITNETFSFDNTSIACINPIRYRGYIYDNETGFYYLNSRYYDPSLRRFVNADDVISGANGDVKGYNLFTYSFNNPVNMDDSNGNWPECLNTVANKAKTFIKKSVKAFALSFQFEIGVGYGLGASAKVDSVRAQASVYHDPITLGFVDGDTYTTFKGSAGFSVGVTDNLTFGVSTSYSHLVEKGYERYWDEHSTLSAAKDVYKCEHTVKEPLHISIPTPGLTSEDGFIGCEAEAHAIFGGHIKVGFNLEKFIKIFKGE